MNAKTLIPLAVIAIALWSKLGGSLPFPSPTPEPVPVVAPSGEMQGFVMPIKTKLAGHREKADVVHALYRDFAKVVERDGGNVIKSTTVFWDAHTRALDLTAAKGEPAVGAEIDAAIEAAMGGKASEALDAPKRARLVEVLKSISWAGT